MIQQLWAFVHSAGPSVAPSGKFSRHMYTLDWSRAASSRCALWHLLRHDTTMHGCRSQNSSKT